ncbi:hypothetical protein AB0F43_02640 [Kribbella sp. NPDC023972]|uniref:hypothetical protein n=1 Tax=Kribbella sp. NPDC023972 TaxID=3154795 RepID=UPI0033D3F0A6
MTERKQLDSLTGLRILAAVWVMLHHFRSDTPTRTWEFPLVDRFIVQGMYVDDDARLVGSDRLTKHRGRHHTFRTGCASSSAQT